MTIKKFFGPTMLALAMGICLRSPVNAVDITSWAQIYHELDTEVLASPLESNWTNSATLRKWVTEGNTNAILELAGQPQTNIASCAAYFALRQLAPLRARDIGLNAGMTSGGWTNLYVFQIIQSLTNSIRDVDFNSTLSRAFMLTPINAMNCSFLVALLPLNDLERWFNDPTRLACMPTYEAIVLDRLYMEFRARKQSPTAKMTNTLASYLLIPGVPRFVFLSQSGPEHPAYQDAMRLCLQDESIPEDMLLAYVMTYANSVEKLVKNEHLDLSSRRRAFLTKSLSFPRRALPIK